MEKEVFISYKAEEVDEASWVRQVLESHNISCWMAPSCIPGGSSYASEIPKAIKNCKVFVLILSSRSQASKWVSREVDLAINYGKTVMPFMLENCDLKDDFNFYLTNVQRYAAYENKLQAAEKMLKEIQAVIGVQAHFDIGSIPPVEYPSGGGMGNGGTGGTRPVGGGMGNGGTGGTRPVGGGMGNGGTGGARQVNPNPNPPRPVNAGALLLTPPSSGEPVFLTREATRTKFGAAGLVGLIFSVLTILFFILMYAAFSAEVSYGYMAKSQMVAMVSLMTFIPAFISLIVCCKGVRGGKKISAVSRIMGYIGLVGSIIVLVIPIVMGLSEVNGEKYWEKAVSYNLYLNVGGADINVKADGTDGEFTYKAEWGIDEDSTCVLNVRCEGEATVSGGELTVNCDSYDRYYTMWFEYSSDSDVIEFINEKKNEFYLLELDPSDVSDVESLCSFSTVRVGSSSALCKIIEGRLNLNKIVVDLDEQHITEVYFDGGHFEAFYYYSNATSAINVYGENGILWQRIEYDEYGNITENIYYDSMGNPVQ